jgi:tyrosinase
MKDEDKKSWIDAVHCMHRSPSKMNKFFPTTRHRYDDFVAFHINATGWDPGTHNNGFFMPFHRYDRHHVSMLIALTPEFSYLLWIWENTLRDECGYKGPTPWWDWSLDTPERGGHFNSSPIWDPVLGFGGDGKWVKNITEELRCVENGPWAQYNVSLTWKVDDPPIERCLERDFDTSLAEKSSSPKQVLKVLLQRDTYANFSELDFAPWGFDVKQGGPHITGHIAVGGEVRRAEHSRELIC